MADNWTNLKMRLQSVAQNRANGGCPGVALVFVNVFLSNGLPIGWYKPQRVPLEPRNFDVSQLPFTNRGDWDKLMRCLSNGVKTGMVNRVLVVREGKPIGWLDSYS